MLPEWFYQLGIMGWPLAICSIAALAIMLERSVFTVKAFTCGKQRYKALYGQLIKHQQQPKTVRDEMVAVMLLELQQPYQRGIKGLRIIGTISPMLGLLGTVLGIITAFKVIAVQVGPVSPSMIADGLWEAMLTTAVGLMIALPSLLMAHLFKTIADRQLNGFCMQLNKVSLSLEMEKVQMQPQPNKPFEKVAA